MTSDELQRALQPLAVWLAPMLAPLVAKELRAQTGDADDPWVDQDHSPLGRRTHCRVCKEGKLDGARKLGKKWLVRRTILDAYVQTKGSAAPEPSPAELTEEERLEQLERAVAAKHGLREVRGR